MTASTLQLSSRSVGGLPIINSIIREMGLDNVFDTAVEVDKRSTLSPAIGLGILLRNLVLSREPLYAVPEWVRGCDARHLRLPSQSLQLSDDRLGRCLDKLFEADRAAIMTRVVATTVRHFGVSLDELHNDSTTVTFEGGYAGAIGQPKKGRPSLRIVRGHNKDHRPDLKQLVYILTTTADGGLPVWHCATHGNTTDDATHLETWEALRRLGGRPDFLYVADSKLCTRENMDHIDQRGGRFVTVLPRTRREAEWFSSWMEKNEPQWEELHRQPNSRLKDGPDEVYSGFQPPLGSAEGYRIVWIRSSQKKVRDILSRQRRLERAGDELNRLAAKLNSAKTRTRTLESLTAEVSAILSATHTADLINYAIETKEEERFKQSRRGRPSEGTEYIRQVKKSFRLHWSHKLEAQKADAKMDGLFPLITNDMKLTLAAILAAYKHQPSLERRHELLKTTLEVMPMNLKSATRIEALLLLFFFAQMVMALLERQLRLAMKSHQIEKLPLYPEERETSRPTATQVIRLFGDLRRHSLSSGGGHVQKIFEDELSSRHSTVLDLLGMSTEQYFRQPEDFKN